MFRRHPPGLYVLFFTEMWERFSFYCMLSVFVLYMTDPNNGHPFLQENSSQIYGLYLMTVYFTPFLGGLLADLALGYRLSIILGAVFMGLGHLLLGVDHIAFFIGGLVWLVFGNGLFKPNISTLVGKLYPAGDPRIDGAFTIFYMGINIGAFISPLVAQFLRVRYGFHTAFAAAGVGMGISMVIFLVFQRWVVYADQPREQPADAAGPPTRYEVPANLQLRRYISLVIIFVIVALFWMAFKQNGNTFNLWARNSTDRTPPAWLRDVLAFTYADRLLLDKNGDFSTELFQCVNPMFVVLFSPVLVWFWRQLRTAAAEPTTPAKIAIGMVLTSLAFLILTSAGWAGGDNEGTRVTPFALLSAYAVITLGELCLSPMGLSLVTKLSAARHRSIWMGGWFAATAIGGYLSGLVGGYWKIWKHSNFFLVLAITSLIACGLMLICYRFVQRAMPVEGRDGPPPAPPPPERPVETAIQAAGAIREFNGALAAPAPRVTTDDAIQELALTDLSRDLWLDTFAVDGESLKLGAPHAWSVRKRTLRGGLADGVDLIEVNNGVLSFSILPTRGMGLWRGAYHGHFLGWQAPVHGPVHPKFVRLEERGGLGWLHGFDEWLCRCGLASNGPPGEDVVTDAAGHTSRTRLTLHGRIANQPAHFVAAGIDLDPPHAIRVTGRVEESGLFYPHLSLTATYITVPGSNRLTIHDVVENRSAQPAEMQMLYHCNVGAPFLEAGSRVHAPFREVAPLTPRAAEGIDTLDTYTGPKAGFAEQVYCYDLQPDASGRTLALLHNRAGDLGMALRFNREELSCFVVWKNTAALEDGYVTGLEPATNYPNFKGFERQQARVRVLPSHGRWECRWEIEVHDTADAVRGVRAEIAALQGATPPLIHRTPQARYTPM